SHETNKPNTPKLKLSKAKDEILIDEITTLTNFPSEALDYKLGNRSAIEWILDGYKEKTQPSIKCLITINLTITNLK
ncbi:MAG: hypothetical protein QM504_14440, partial [Pseudomonadota bacterium]